MAGKNGNGNGKKSGQLPKAAWRNRITGHGEKPAKDFRFNPLNFRLHPPEQREAVRKMLGLVGWVTEVIENERTGNLIDGQARIEEALRQDPEQLIPFTKVNLSLAEEKAVLATLDPMTGMAETNQETLDRLIDETVVELPDVEELLKVLHLEANGDGDEGEPKSRTVEFKQHLRIVIECRSKRQQSQLAKRFESEGLEFRAT